MVEPGGALKKAIEAVIDDDATSVRFKAEFSTDISESPKGTLTASATRVRPDAPVDFTVDLAPTTIAYFLLGDNVTGVQLYRKGENELAFTRWRAMDRIASNRATYRWVPTEADAGKYEFAAFVNTQLPTPLLEVAPNSIKPVEASCFSGGSSRGRSAVRHAAAAVCADTWVGTVTHTLKFGGVPQYTTTSSITWTYDPTSSEPGVIAYTASGSFDLVLHDQIGCAYSASPNTFAIQPNALFAKLSIIEGEEPIYTWSGSQQVSYTKTSMCPGWDHPVDDAIVDQLVGLGNGSGPYVAGQARLTGSINTSTLEVAWDFARP